MSESMSESMPRCGGPSHRTGQLSYLAHKVDTRDRLFRIVHSANRPHGHVFAPRFPVRPRAESWLKSLRNNNLLSGRKADTVSALPCDNI